MTLTYTTRLKIPDIAEKHYLNDRFKFYGQIEYRLFNQLIKGKIIDDKLREEVGHTYGISGRKANSLVRKVRGRINALRELKAFEYENIRTRCIGIQEAIAKTSDKLFNLKLRASLNTLTKEDLGKLRYLKGKKHRLSLMLNKLTQHIENFDKHSNSLCFGTKRLFKAQFYLDENGYATHNEWLRDWRKARTNSWYFVGAAADKGLGFSE